MSATNPPPDAPAKDQAHPSEARSALVRIGRNAASILLGGALGDAITTITLAYSALKLGSAGFGALSSAQAFLDPFSTLAMFGLGVVSMTVAARQAGPDGALLGTLAGLHSMLSAAAASAAMVLAAVTGRADMLPLLAVLSLSLLTIPVNAPSNLPLQYDQAMQRVLAVPLAAALVRLFLTYVAVSWHNTPVAHQVAATVGGLVSTLLIFRISRRHAHFAWRFDAMLAKKLLLLAWPAAVLEVTVMIYSRASYLFLESAGREVQGHFAAADRLSRPVLGLASALVASSLPSVARLAAEDDAARLWRVYRAALTRSAQFLLPLAALAALAAPWVLRRYAPAYAPASTPFQVLLVGTLFMFINQLSAMFIIGIGRFKLIMAIALMNLVVYVALAAILVPLHGALGAALATTIMEGVNGIVQVCVMSWLLRARALARRGAK